MCLLCEEKVKDIRWDETETNPGAFMSADG